MPGLAQRARPWPGEPPAGRAPLVPPFPEPSRQAQHNRKGPSSRTAPLPPANLRAVPAAGRSAPASQPWCQRRPNPAAGGHQHPAAHNRAQINPLGPGTGAVTGNRAGDQNSTPARVSYELHQSQNVILRRPAIRPAEYLAMSAATIVRVSDRQIIRSGASLTACPVTGTVVQAGGRRVLQEQNQSQRVTLSRGGYAAGTPSIRADSSARTAQRGAQPGRFGAGPRQGPRA